MIPEKYLDGCTYFPNKFGKVDHSIVCFAHDMDYWYKRTVLGKIKADIERRLRFAEFADVHFISALHGTGVGNLYDSVGAAYSAATDTLSASRLTKVLEGAVEEHQPPMVHGRRIKLRFAHAGGRNPPVIVVHGNQTDAVPKHYTRFLEKIFRRELDLHGTPVRVEYKTSDNPFKERKKSLSDSQQHKRRRAIKKHHT